ncbi:MAG: hypothetical protein LUE26_02160 [Alistipes sp.]|nr:hypothetical protein [Alistipes sp.]
MKTIRDKIYSGALLFGALSSLASCSDADKECSTEGGETIYEISRVALEMTETETESPGAVTRASGFVVNTDDDPTYTLTAKHGWTLDLVIYDKDGDPYAEGQGSLTWDGSYWSMTGTQLYMPNYLMQYVSALLYPATWTEGVSTIETDQSDEDVFLRQDILVQDGVPSYRTDPAHYLDVRMRHGHSMLDIVLANVNPDDIESVKVIVGGNEYTPFQPNISSREEYLVILPVGSQNPEIQVTTKAGAVYRKVLAVGMTAINYCYYIRLVGLELELEAVTVTSWTYGEAVPADYSSPTSYPTFRGTENTDLAVYYDNGTDQILSFNDSGEATEKPLGRTIIRIESGGLLYEFPQPLSIRTMVVDLNPYIALMT